MGTYVETAHAATSATFQGELVELVGGWPDLLLNNHEEQVALARVWLQRYAVRTLRIRSDCAYGHKHEVEHWLGDIGTPAYISSTAFVVAAASEGFIVRLSDRPSGARFGFCVVRPYEKTTGSREAAPPSDEFRARVADREAQVHARACARRAQRRIHGPVRRTTVARPRVPKSRPTYEMERTLECLGAIAADERLDAAHRKALLDLYLDATPSLVRARAHATYNSMRAMRGAGPVRSARTRTTEELLHLVTIARVEGAFHTEIERQARRSLPHERTPDELAVLRAMDAAWKEECVRHVAHWSSQAPVAADGTPRIRFSRHPVEDFLS